MTHETYALKLASILGLDPTRLNFLPQSIRYLDDYLFLHRFDWAFREAVFQYLLYYLGEVHLGVGQGEWGRWNELVSGTFIPDILIDGKPRYIFDKLDILLTPDDEWWPNLHEIYNGIIRF